MAKPESTSQAVPSFEYELLDSDSDHLRTVVASSSSLNPRIEPSKLKLRHRIGRGLFGDVWLATHHQSTNDYDEYHEVAVKMLNPIKEDHMRAVLDKIEDHFYKCQGAKGVCGLYGMSIINGKLCIIMKFYEGSVADKMARLKEGKISLPDIVRYGINLAQGILELHSREILVLNLKPSNVLLTTNDQAILGDLGTPYLLHGIPIPNSDVIQRLGTPNYMAPEQWQPEVRGPISYETDSWGFACCLVEMLTGVQPWRGKSVDEIFHSVVRKQEKPCFPSGLPPLIENVLLGCFEYDLRSRPLMRDILHVFQSSQHVVNSDWEGIGNSKVLNKSSPTGHTEWFLSKDNLQVGDLVRSRKPLNSCKPENMYIPEGRIVGLERETEKDAFVLVRVRGIHDPRRVYASTLERVSFGLAAGDWIRLKEAEKKHSPVGILHAIDRGGNVAVAFIGVETLWKGNSSQFQMAESFCVGQFVRIKGSILRPRFEWPRKEGGWATGRIWWILPNGCLMVKFPGILTFKEESDAYMADPAEVEVVNFSTCLGMVEKYQHLEDFHWSIRPLLFAFGLFTAMKLGFAFGKKVGRSKVKKGQSNIVHCETQHIDGQNTSSNNPAWIPPPVKNILFGEGISAIAR